MERRSELLRRIALIESDLERYGSDYRDSASHAEPACAVLHEPRAYVTRARILRRAGGRSPDRDAIEAALGAALEAARRNDAVCQVPLVHLERAELARALGDDALLRSELETARRLFTEMGAMARAEQVGRS